MSEALKNGRHRGIDTSIKSPRYHQLYSVLKDWILSGTYLPGAKLPTEAELCETFGVSRMTSHKAINLMVQEGLLTRIQGKGTYVSSDLELPASVGDMSQLIERINDLSKNTKVIDVEIETIPGDEEVCEDLELGAGEEVIRITFVRVADDEPIDYREAFVPAALGLKFTKSEIKANSMYTLFERKGLRPSTGHLVMGATLADTRFASQLSTTVGAPLLRNRLVVFDESGIPIQKSVTHFRADRFEQYVYLGHFDPKSNKISNLF